MLYFSKLRITLVSLVTLFFIFIAASNFQDSENSLISKRINLGLDLQGGSYLLLEIDNEPVKLQKLQNTTTTIRNYLKGKKINFTDLRIEDKAIFFDISKANIELVRSFFLDKESQINPYYNQYKSHQFDLSVQENVFKLTLSKSSYISVTVNVRIYMLSFNLE